MRIKSKFEINFIHVAVLAVCPLISIVMNFVSGMTILLLSVISYILSALICLILAKNASRQIKVFLTAVVASLIVVGYELLAKNGMYQSVGDIAYYSILSTIVLSVDLYYLNSKSDANYFLKMVRLLFVYSIVMLIYVPAKEFLSFGTISGIKLGGYEGYEFFRLVTFDFVLLGLLCALINRIVAIYVEYHNEKVMLYNKYKTKIRKEKGFIYDQYRRRRLLSSEVIINNVSDNESEDGEESEDNKEAKSTESDVKDSSDEKSKKSVIKHKPKTNRKLKVSKEAKIEKLFDRKDDKEDDE